MDINVIIHQMVQLFIMIALGYLLRKIGYINDEVHKKVTAILLNVTLPCTILSSVFSQETHQDVSVVIMGFISGFIMIGIQILFGIGFGLVARIPDTDRGMYTFMMGFANVGFMGIPICASMFGNTGTLYAAIFNIVFNIMAFTLGVYIINMKPRSAGTVAEEGSDLYGKTEEAIGNDASEAGSSCRAGAGKRIMEVIRTIATPGLVFSTLAIVIYISEISFPEDLVNTVSTLGGVTTPMAMLLIGGSLAKVSIREVFTDSKIYIFILAKHMALPLLMLPVIQLLVRNTDMVNVYFCLTLMPVANMAMLFATQYGRDETLPSKVIFLSTLASIVTVPVMLALTLG